MSDLSALHATLEAPLRGYLRRRAPVHVDVDDLLQEVWLRLHRVLPNLRDVGAAEAVAWRTARSVLVDHLRRHHAGEPLPDDPGEDCDAREDAATTVVASWLPAFVEVLPEPYREAVRLVDLQGVPQAELAERLGLSRSGARTRVQRGRERLRELLLACCAVRFDEGEVVDVRRQQDGCGGC